MNADYSVCGLYIITSDYNKCAYSLIIKIISYFYLPHLLNTVSRRLEGECEGV
jgi:hypothetical protein